MNRSFASDPADASHAQRVAWLEQCIALSALGMSLAQAGRERLLAMRAGAASPATPLGDSQSPA